MASPLAHGGIGDALKFPIGSGEEIVVKSCQPNAYGLYDMHGNVWEWCEDAYQGRLPGGDDPLVRAGTDRVLRSGSWGIRGEFCRSAFRHWDSPGGRGLSNGLRLAAVHSR